MGVRRVLPDVPLVLAPLPGAVNYEVDHDRERKQDRQDPGSHASPHVLTCVHQQSMSIEADIGGGQDNYTDTNRLDEADMTMDQQATAEHQPGQVGQSEGSDGSARD